MSRELQTPSHTPRRPMNQAAPMVLDRTCPLAEGFDRHQDVHQSCHYRPVPRKRCPPRRAFLGRTARYVSRETHSALGPAKRT